MRATDADDPTTANGELRYTLRPDGERTAFEIDSITGRPAAPRSTKLECVDCAMCANEHLVANLFVV